MPLSVKVAIGIMTGAVTTMLIYYPINTLVMLAFIGIALSIVRVVVFIIQGI